MEHSYENADALVRAVRSATAEPLVEFVGSLIKQQYALSYVCQLAQHALAFERWCEDRRISFHALTDPRLPPYGFTTITTTLVKYYEHGSRGEATSMNADGPRRGNEGLGQ